MNKNSDGYQEKDVNSGVDKKTEKYGPIKWLREKQLRDRI